MKILGPERILYGSDYCISHVRGTNLPVGNSFVWLYEDCPVWEAVSYAKVAPTLVGIENLRAIKAACWALGLNDTQVENLFWGNAARLLGIV